MNDRPIIAHINLARGYRGGERQTELLIRELAERGYAQRLIARQSEPLIVRLADVEHLDRRAVSGIVSATRALRGAALAHVHEGRGIQAAALAHRLMGIRYMVTRRVTRPLSQNRFTKAMYRNAEQLIGLSTHIEQQLKTFAPNQKTAVIPDAITPTDADKAHVRELRKQFGPKPIVGHVGALVTRTKGQDTLIDAARERPDLTFVLVGSGADEATLKASASALDNVHFTGQVTDVASHLAAFDLFAFPSRSEGLGSILLDAMQFELPIVAAAVDGIPDIIQHGQNGLLVPPDDAPALVAALDRLLGNDDLQLQFAEENRQRIEHYSTSAMADRYSALYDALTG